MDENEIKVDEDVMDEIDDGDNQGGSNKPGSRLMQLNKVKNIINH